MLTREDVVRITENVLRDLSLAVIEHKGSDTRTIILYHGIKEINRVNFSITENNR